ncbi:MAG: hypothetical protein U9Q79_02920 [Candidatus Hydrogenedentes bacterium]|nr:hypothetical protein [Candidatus Hydrogenedentota bacterium]
MYLSRNSTLSTLAALVLGGIAIAHAASEEAPHPYLWSKAAKEHVEEIGETAFEYRVTMGDTLDGFNTVECLDTYGGHMRQESRFEPNDYVVLENIGDVAIINPRIVINGRRDWYSADSILAGVLMDEMTDAEKAMAIFRFASRIDVQAHDNNRRVGPPFPGHGTEHENRETSHPSRSTFKERANPVKAANSYYCSGCSLSANKEADTTT